ncbi:hypothetical protein DYI24_02555 [Rhodopseudomonas sp. BR0C11]|uniref:hypothetical protein n=1 Tax=Rhodopseudomonas sp. BR0C11 TaxID=2269370 RepID=UPI0013E02919|nr:hypothetical protein [Rhodopseudomonas sp. BR0C11]NEV75926.1 hypothetical protein [Rhodopseudomonas sp. BR0C11]
MEETTKSAASLPSKNSSLWLLKHEVDDEQFLRIICDFARLIRRSEKACDEAARQDNPNYRAFVIDAECDYLEELVGSSFLLLQAKIRRVRRAAKELNAFMNDQHGLAVDIQDEKIINLHGSYRNSEHSQIKLIWEIGNYYKHRDEWDHEVWEDVPAQGRDPLEQPRRTRRTVQAIGIVQFSTGNLRQAYEFFEIQPYSKCEKLAKEVQAWAKDVYQLAKEECQRATDEHIQKQHAGRAV